MPEEQDNQIERREPGGISRRSENARRGSDAAGFVKGIASRRTEAGSSSTASTNHPYEFVLKWGMRGKGDGEFVSKWGTPGEGDGEFNRPIDVAVAPDGSVYVPDTMNHRIQKFSRVSR